MFPTDVQPTGVRKAYTLLELVAATAITSTVLVATLALLRDSMDVSRRVQTNDRLTSLCVSRMEQYMALTAATFTNTTVTGDFTSDGYPQLHYRVVCSDNPASGGITARLMTVSATVWDDLDGDNSQDSEEPAVSFSSKIAKLAEYEDEASGA